MIPQIPQKIAITRGKRIHGSGEMDQAVLQHPIEIAIMPDAQTIRPYVARSLMSSNMRRGA